MCAYHEPIEIVSCGESVENLLIHVTAIDLQEVNSPKHVILTWMDPRQGSLVHDQFRCWHPAVS